MLNQHQLIDIGTETVVVCSLLHTFLPPWDFLADFPKAQKLYKVFVYLVGYIGLNARSTVYQSVSMKSQVANGKTEPPNSHR